MTKSLKKKFMLKDAFSGDVYVTVANDSVQSEEKSKFSSGDIALQSGRDIKKFDTKESALSYCESRFITFVEIVEFYE